MPKAISLKDAAEAENLLFGCPLVNISETGIARYGELFDREVGAMPVEFQANWSQLQPTEGSFSFSGMDSVVTYAKNLGVPIIGGNLVYNWPSWVDTKLGATPSTWDAVIDAHASAVMTRDNGAGIDYATDIGEWWVCNELFLESDPNGVFRESVFWTAAQADTGEGADFVAYAFTRARVYAPTATLVLNQNQLDTAPVATRYTNMLTWIDTWLTAGVPIDAVGTQSHIQFNTQFDPTNCGAFIDGVHDRGLEFIVTEFDGRASGSGSTWKQRQEIARYGKDYLDFILGRGVRKVYAWGLTGDHWWLEGAVDGTPWSKAPHKPTPLRDAMLQSFKSAWRPTDISNIYAWWSLADCIGTWRASPSGTTQTGPIAEALVALQAAEPGEDYFLTSIIDLVSGRNLAQGTAAAQPEFTTLVNGLPTVDFEGTDDYLTVSYGATINQPNTVLLHHQYLGGDTGTDAEFASTISFPNRNTFRKNTSENYALFAGGGANSDDPVSTNREIMVAEFNGASSRILNRNTVLHSGNAGTESATGFRLGANQNAAGFANQRVLSAYVFDGLLSARDRQRLIEWEDLRWG